MHLHGAQCSALQCRAVQCIASALRVQFCGRTCTVLICHAPERPAREPKGPPVPKGSRVAPRSAAAEGQCAIVAALPLPSSHGGQDAELEQLGSGGPESEQAIAINDSLSLHWPLISPSLSRLLTAHCSLKLARSFSLLCKAKNEPHKALLFFGRWCWLAGGTLLWMRQTCATGLIWPTGRNQLLG